MALYYDLPVYRDTYKLILKIFEYTKDFPKEYKYTLPNAEIKNVIMMGSLDAPSIMPVCDRTCLTVGKVFAAVGKLPKLAYCLPPFGL